MTIDQKVYTPGDFVYYDVPENKRKSIFIRNVLGVLLGH